MRKCITLMCVVGLVLGCGKSDEKVKSPAAQDGGKDAPAAKAPLPEPVHTGSAMDYAKEFEKNKVGVLKNYQGKVVQLTGKVYDCRQNDLGWVVIILGDRDTSFLFTMREPEPWANYGPGQELTIRGKQSHGDWLEECVVINPPAKTTTPTMSVGDLVKELQADVGKATEKYHGERLILEGVVTETKKHDFGGPSVFLKVEGDWRVSYRISSVLTQEEKAEALKAGDKVKAEGGVIVKEKEKELILNRAYFITK